MKVTIRPLRKEDAYTSVHWRNDPEVFKYTGNTYNHEISLDSELKWITQVISNSKEKRFAIEADGIYIGNVYLTDIENKQAEYHIFIGNKEYWGKGCAKRASKLIIEYGFNTLGLEKIILNVKKENTAAYKLYLSLGFKNVKEENQTINMELYKNSFPNLRNS